MQSQFKEGDVVQLKSGGPKMTVVSITDGDNEIVVECRYFDKADSLKVVEFSQEELKKWNPTTGVRVLNRS